MRSGAVTLLFLLCAYVLQTTLFAHFFYLVSKVTGIADFASQRFDFAFLALIYLSLHRSRSSALVWAVIIGLLANSFGLAWRGASSFGLVSLALLGSLLKGRVMIGSASSIMILVAIFTILEALLHLSVGKMVHGNAILFWGQASHVFRQVMIQTMVAPLVFYFLKMLDQWTGGIQERRSFPLTNF